MRRMLSRLAPLALIALLTGCGSEGSDDEKQGTGSGVRCDYASSDVQPAKPVDPPPADASVTNDVTGAIELSQGTIGISLTGSTDPCTVSSFVSLAEQGYFDDTSCHRLTTAEAGIAVLQCGDPTASGTGGPGYTIPDELTGEETYPAGTLAMAKTPAPDSGGSQFFLVYGETPLPPDYTVFGTIDEAGLKVVQKIAEAGTASGTPDGPPKNEVRLDTVTIG
jgi:peptidyl-prolyl cis-trans isomerase B (cyclophilin B)